MSQRERFLFFALFCFLIVWDTLYFGQYLFWSDPSSEGRWGMDFIVFWQAAKALIADNYGKVYDVALLKEYFAVGEHAPGFFGPFPYPPPALLFIKPLGYLSERAAFVVWSGAGMLAFLISLWAAAKNNLLPTLTHKPALLAFAILTCLTSPMAIYTLIAGQTGFFVGAILISGMVLLDKKPRTAGIILGLLVCKPQLALMAGIVILITRNWQALSAAALTALCLALLSTATYGIEIWNNYISMAQSFTILLKDNPVSFCSMGVSPFIAAKCLQLDNTVATLFQAGLTLGSIGAICWLWHQKTTPDIRLTAFFTLTFLATPYSMAYDLPVLGFALMLIMDRVLHNGFHHKEKTIILSFIALILLIPLLQPFHIPIATAALAMLYFYYARRART